jgi:hypothetical protein
VYSSDYSLMTNMGYFGINVRVLSDFPTKI